MKKIMCILFVLGLMFTAQAGIVNGTFDVAQTNVPPPGATLSGNPIGGSTGPLNKGWGTNAYGTTASSAYMQIIGGVASRSTGGAGQIAGIVQFYTDSQVGALKLKYDLQITDANSSDTVYVQLYGYKYQSGTFSQNSVMTASDGVVLKSNSTGMGTSTNWTVTQLVNYSYVALGTLNGGAWTTQTNDFSDTDVTAGEYDMYGLRIMSTGNGAPDIVQFDNVVVVDPYHFLLTVNYGNGGGSYTNTAQVNITASNAPNGKVFDQWTGDTGYISSNTASTTVTMPDKPIALTATYKDAPTYTLTINYGDGGGAYSAGYVASITASNAPVGQTFDKWTGDTQYVASVTSPSTTVTMPAQAIALTATYKAAYSLTVNYGTYTGSGWYDSGAVVPISASNAPAGQVFDKWTGDTQYVANVGATNTTVTMPAANIAVTATYALLPVTGNWINPAGGNWSDSGNWSNGIVPNASRDTANIKTDITSDQTVALDTAVTLGALAIGPVSTSSGGAYTLAGPNTLTFNNGANGATLTDTAGKSGNTTISADVLLQNNLAVTVQAVSNTLVLSGNISGSGASLTKLNPGWVKLFGTNSYSGGTILSVGKLAINSDRSLGAVPASPQVNLVSSNRWNWLMAYDNITLNSNRNVQLTAKGGIAVKDGKTLDIRGQISGVGPTINLNFNPDSVLPEDPEATVWHGNVVFAPGNTYTNDTTGDTKTVLCYGRLYISADSCLGAVPASYYYRDVILADGNYGNPTYAAILSATETFALNANRGVSLQSSKNAIEVAAGKTLTMQGPVVAETSKPGAGLNKLGDGTLVLNGLNTYTGNTTVVAGKLLVNDSLPAGEASTVSVNGGATLGGTGTISNPVTVAATGTLAPGVTAGTLTVAADVTLASSAVLSVDAGASSDQLNLAAVGAISLSGANLSVIDTAPITTGTVITIVNNATSVTGQFTGLTEGATLDTANNRYTIHYGTTSVSLTVVAKQSYIAAGSTNKLVGVVSGNYTFNIGIVSGAVCHVEASTNLLNTNGWTNISGPLVSTSGTVPFADTNTAAFPVRMYRVLSP